MVSHPNSTANFWSFMICHSYVDQKIKAGFWMVMAYSKGYKQGANLSYKVPQLLNSFQLVVESQTLP